MEIFKSNETGVLDESLTLDMDLRRSWYPEWRGR